MALIVPLSGYAQERAVPVSQEQVQLSFSPVVKAVSPAVVNIYTKRTVARRIAHPFMNDPFFEQFFGRGLFSGRMREQLESSLGSGVIVSEDGMVVTNAHVIEGAQEITVVLADDQEIPAEIIIRDEASDLALLQAKTDEILPHVTLKPSEVLEVGDIVLAIGNPFGVGQTVTSGIVSAQGRSSLNINDFNFFIQTDAAINPGNSGGPLVALDGHVVGINTAIYSRDGGSLGIGFAIPSEMVASVIAAAKGGGVSESGAIVRPWLGVTAQSVTSDIADSLDLSRPSGALISQLHPASPLKDAGLKSGDLVIKVGGYEIRDPAEMKFRMATVPIGETTSVTAVRNGREQTYTVKAIAPPDEPARNTVELTGDHAFNGAKVANLNPAVAVELGLGAHIDNTKPLVVVTHVAPGTPAARFIRPGDILIEINDQTIEKPSDVPRALEAGGRVFSLIFNRGGRTQQLVLR